MTSDIFSLEDDLGDITSSMSYSSWNKPITSVEDLMSATNSTCEKEDEHERSDAYAATLVDDSANPDVPRTEEQQPQEETKTAAVVAKESSKKSEVVDVEMKSPEKPAAVPELPLSSTDFLPDCGDTESLEKEVGNNDKIKEITIDYDSVQEEEGMYHPDNNSGLVSDKKEAADSTKKAGFKHSLGTKFVKIFPGMGTFYGKVVSHDDDYDDKVLMYGVEYEDGDYEDLSEKELEEALAKSAAITTARIMSYAVKIDNDRGGDAALKKNEDVKEEAARMDVANAASSKEEIAVSKNEDVDNSKEEAQLSPHHQSSRIEYNENGDSKDDHARPRRQGSRIKYDEDGDGKEERSRPRRQSSRISYNEDGDNKNEQLSPRRQTSRIKDNQPRPPKHNHPVGTAILKHFHGCGWFRGKVESLWRGEHDGSPYYTIEYDDGDKDDLSEQEVDDYLSNYDSNKEQWEEKMKHPVGTEIIKEFEQHGWFKGEVESHGMRDDAIYYIIKYEDGDIEDLSEQEVDELVAKYDLNLTAWETEHGITPKKKGSRKRSPSKAQGEPKSKRQRKGGEKGKQTSRKSLSVCISRMQNKSIFDVLKPVDGAAVTREAVLDLVKSNPPPPDKIPEDLHKCIPEMLEFHLLARERQRVFLGLGTEQKILMNAHICNNYRELDRGTGYLRSQILELRDYMKENMIPFTRLNWTEEVLALIYHYRLSNRIESFLYPENPLKGRIPRRGEFSTFEPFVWECQAKQRNFFTQAHQTISFKEYVSYCSRVTEYHPYEKVDGKKVTKLRLFATEIVKAKDNLRNVCKILNCMQGIGTFQGWQLACDLQEAHCLLEGDDVFCVLGPGARNGLMNTFGDEVNGKYNSLQLTTVLRDSLDYCMGLFNLEFPLWKGQPLTLKVVEHVLCEFNKFKRLETGQDVGLRKRQSFAHLDPKVCQWCRKSPPSSQITRCDSCRRVACKSCKPSSFVCSRNEAGGQSNTCRDCHEFDTNFTLIEDDVHVL